MMCSFQHLEVHEQDGVHCVRIKNHKLQELGLEQLSTEIAKLIDDDGCRKLVLSLGPGDMECLYSVFLAKLVNFQRKLQKAGGVMVLAEVSDNTLDVFRVTGLERVFKFYPDPKAAVKELI